MMMTVMTMTITTTTHWSCYRIEIVSWQKVLYLVCLSPAGFFWREVCLCLL